MCVSGVVTSFLTSDLCTHLDQFVKGLIDEDEGDEEGEDLLSEPGEPDPDPACQILDPVHFTELKRTRIRHKPDRTDQTYPITSGRGGSYHHLSVMFNLMGFLKVSCKNLMKCNDAPRFSGAGTEDHLGFTHC